MKINNKMSNKEKKDRREVLNELAKRSAFPMKLSKKKTRMKQKQIVCDKCNSKNYYHDKLAIKDNNVMISEKCFDCHNSWTNVFEFKETVKHTDFDNWREL